LYWSKQIKTKAVIPSVIPTIVNYLKKVDAINPSNKIPAL